MLTKKLQERELAFEGIVDEWDEIQGNEIMIMVGAKPDGHITHSISHPTKADLRRILAEQLYRLDEVTPGAGITPRRM